MFGVVAVAGTYYAQSAWHDADAALAAFAASG